MKTAKNRAITFHTPHTSKLRVHPLSACLFLAVASSVVNAASAPTGTKEQASIARDPNAVAAALGVLLPSLDVQPQTLPQNKRTSTPTSAAAVGSVLPVANCSDDVGDAGSLRSVVESAISGDIVDMSSLTCSTIYLTNGAISTPIPDLRIRGPGEQVLTIDGGGESRVFAHTGYGTLSLSGMTITHGLATGHGGCVFSNGKLDLESVTVSSCTAYDFGGGIFAYSLDMRSSTISGNSIASGMGGAGGGLLIFGDTAIANSMIQNNSINGSVAAVGGGIYVRYGDLTLVDSTISGNNVGAEGAESFSARGGGFYQTESHLAGRSGFFTTKLTRTTVSDNTVHQSFGRNIFGPRGGGGELFRIGKMIIEDSAISNNIIDSELSLPDVFGAGLLAVIYNQASITGSTISGNAISATGSASSYSGAGLTFSTYGNIAISNSTIAFNSASSAGGGIVWRSAGPLGLLTLQSNIVADNAAPTAADLFISDSSGVLPGIAGSNNLIVDAGSGETLLPPDTLRADPLLLPLENNGGPTWTHALDPASPAVDGGNNMAGLADDQRGFPYARVAGSAADIGAFEVQPPVVSVEQRLAPTLIEIGDASRLTITMFNSNPDQATLESPLIDTFPPGVVVAALPDASSTCPGGSFVANSGANSVTLDAAARIPANGGCAVTVSVSALVGGAFTNVIAAGSLQTDKGSNAEPASADLVATAARSDTVFYDGFDGACDSILPQDGGFEATGGDLGLNPYWSSSVRQGATVLTDSVFSSSGFVHAGTYAIWFGGYRKGPEEAEAHQVVTIPTGSQYWLNYWRRIGHVPDSRDYVTFTVDDQVVLVDDLSVLGVDNTWSEHSIDVSGYADGGPHAIKITYRHTYANNDDADYYLDDMMLTCQPIAGENQTNSSTSQTY